MTNCQQFQRISFYLFTINVACSSQKNLQAICKFYWCALPKNVSSILPSKFGKNPTTGSQDIVQKRKFHTNMNPNTNHTKNNMPPISSQ